MNAQPAPASRRPADVAPVACDAIELLDLVWDTDRGQEPGSGGSTVSASQLRVLRCLERGDGINLRTLSELLGSPPSSVSRLCDRLEATGLVERGPSPVSRRELTLRLTGRGRGHLRGLRERREESLRRVVRAMPPAARSALRDGLVGFRAALEAGPQAPGERPGDAILSEAAAGAARTASVRRDEASPGSSSGRGANPGAAEPEGAGPR
ncbi:hypothetical protein GCM10018785_08210 [Streptomyces longispororuber]|uniref:HTH marR-type domain-containing protein n=1 Tax=Streptomyces longispororuber TaxID=68230 RepID=A0A918Z994_9ACTN|nr:MarR family transcriptional regulator [Streptomyces longispororuber]GHE41019.1 hypothetical protein GCM10018785_08210 [Streptomyces longispororuber]